MRSSSRRALGALIALAAAATLGTGCDDAATGVEFCDESAECSSGMSCVEGLCVDEDAISVLDATADGTDPGDATTSTSDGTDPGDATSDATDPGETTDPGDVTDPGDGDMDAAEMTPTCGNGALDTNELCDIAIPAGEAGACPVAADCVSTDTCATVGLTGTACDQACAVVSTIDICTNADGCCPSGVGCDSSNDDDCTNVCGNGVLETGEACDTTIAAGMAGACPDAASCMPADSCSTAAISGTECDAVCAQTAITTCDMTTSDGCCPSGLCDATTDIDCTATCGNGVVEMGEDCDSAIAAGMPGACEDATTCVAASACETATLSGAACNVVCDRQPIQICSNGDSCCPVDANGMALCDATNDDACAPVCGNGVREAAETCDTAIASGQADACPDAGTCVPNNACESAMVVGTDCDAVCQRTTVPDNSCSMTSDGCCPNGCDSGNDADCAPSCGNGVLDGGEACDTAIPAGSAGACPSAATCMPADSCQATSIVGTACDAVCMVTTQTTCANGDLCCPTDSAGSPVCANTQDNDCPVVCGNGVQETGEDCDTSIPAGQAGACPTAASCQPVGACGTATFSGSACNAVCTTGTITTCGGNTTDGCCPGGCDQTTDADCMAVCGNGTVESGETCDTAIAAGQAGACATATTCVPGNACESATLTGSACTTQCTVSVTTSCQNGDGCCAFDASMGMMCNATNDNDCMPVCGNGVPEGTEECDDGGNMDGDGCSAACLIEAVTVRIDVLELRDPVAYADIFGCRNVNNDVFAQPALNSQLQAGVSGDSDGDGLIDLGIVGRFIPLDPAANMLRFDAGTADCTDPGSPCTETPGMPLEQTTYSAFAAPGSACLAANAANTGTANDASAYPASSTPGSTGTACFASAAVNLDLSIVGVSVPLSSVQIAGEFATTGPTRINNGLLLGFLTESDADTIMVTLPIAGTQPLSALLQGANCTDDNGTGDDSIDVGPNPSGAGTVPGWWFHLNFEAGEVTWN